MRYLASIVLIFFLCFTSSAQVRKAEHAIQSSLYAPDSFPNIAKLLRVDTRDKIRFNFWIRNLSDTTNTLFVAKKNKDGYWHSVSVKFSSWDWKAYRIIKIDTLVLGAEWNYAWNNLIAHDFLLIKSYREASANWIKKPGDIILPVDGKQYCVEIFCNNKYKYYVYNNPVLLNEAFFSNSDIDNINYVVNELTNYLYTH